MSIIRGKIIVIKSKKDYYKIRNGVILITKETTPDLVIVINRIKAIVTEVDNKLCHAAIVAREFDKPILMGIKNATKKFKTGEEITINLDNKIINKTGWKTY